MQKESLFLKYFALFCVALVLSITVLGCILLAFASQYFQDERYDLLERNARRAGAATINTLARADDRIVVMYDFQILYNMVTDADTEIFFVDLEGNVHFAVGAYSQELEGATVPLEAVERSISEGYKNTTNFGGIFRERYYVVGVPVQADGVNIGVLFAASSAQNLRTFLTELGKMFVISAVVVVFVSSAIIYIITAQLVRPLKDMLLATQSFTQGDFTRRVPVGSYDEIGQLAMAFNNMASTLATTEQTRRSFVANVSHELKTPMTTIGGFVDGILDGTIPEERREHYLHTVSNEVKRLSRLVRSMLDTARIEAGELQINPVQFDISEIIRQTLFAFERTIEEKQIQIKGLEVDKVMVVADKDLMHQVVYNLVENAVKFVNEEGTISFRYQSDGQRTYIAIRNTGAGIDREEVPQLFERFYKSDKSRSLNKNGVGLGLHIVKSLIQYHRGEIVVRSAEGEYTEFEFSIPDPPPVKSVKKGQKDAPVSG